MKYQIFCVYALFKKNKFSVESLYHKDSNMFRQLNKVKRRSVRLVFGWVTKYEYPVL